MAPLAAGAAADRLPLSVVIRSFNRLDSLATLLRHCLAQKDCTFEIVVVEQTTEASDDARRDFEAVARDPRVRVLRHPPLGGARARNVGVRAARGEVLLFLDDDDLPLGAAYFAGHLANYADPRCLGVTGRNVDEPGEAVPYPDPDVAYARCMTYSPTLRMPWIYARSDRRKEGVQALHGGSSSVRRDAIERFGLWDETTRIEDEASFCYRLMRGKRPDEYLVFDPTCIVARGKDLPGGLAKRRLPPGRHFHDLLVFIHVVIGRYYPWRVFLLYPAYVAVAWRRTRRWVQNEARGSRWTFGTALSLALSAPGLWLSAVRTSLHARRAPTPVL